MNKKRPPLDKTRLLLTNDDGIAAPGLKVLVRVARQLSGDVWVCAPETEQSGAGHSLTLRHPLRLRRVSRRRHAVDGTPTDCVLLALHHILKDRPPDLVLSGINRGGNMGEDITYSGTVAAAMEATLLGVPAIALSQHLSESHTKAHWSTAEQYAADLVRRLWDAGWPEGVFINVNFPDVSVADMTGIEVTRQGQRKIGENLDQRTDPRGRSYFWVGTLRNDAEPAAGTDLAAVHAGRVSVTPVHMDLTHRAAASALRKSLGEHSGT
ncbi:MAG: 5'/3'-nucleotidase SurE [Alphaproteobacteria bacterium]